jgi:hypothetical protein
MFPVDQSKHPLATTFTLERLKQVETTLDLTSWDILGLKECQTTFLPIRVGCGPSISKEDRVMAVGYSEIESWQRSGAQMISYREEMRGSIGRVLNSRQHLGPRLEDLAHDHC